VTRDGRIVLARDARVELADVPFVPLRNLFERDLVKRPSTFTALVQSCRVQVADQARRNIKLKLWRFLPQVQINRQKVRLSSRQHLFLTLLAQAAVESRPPFSKYAEACDELRKLGKKLYDQRDPDNFSDWRFGVKLPDDTDDLTFRKLRDELIDKLEAADGDAAALISLLPEGGRCSLDLPARSIAFVD
jgi:hypothetical protein